MVFRRLKHLGTASLEWDFEKAYARIRLGYGSFEIMQHCAPSRLCTAHQKSSDHPGKGVLRFNTGMCKAPIVQFACDPLQIEAVVKY